MDLLIPALSVAYIERINEKITRIPLGAEAFYGLITLRELSIVVIDLFSLIAEVNSIDIEQSMQHNTHHINHVMVMDNGSYALACDNINQMITLNPEDIRWNRSSFCNPLFAGIVTEYLCPMVNIDNLYQQVAEMIVPVH